MNVVPPEVLRPASAFVAVLSDTSSGSLLARALDGANDTATGGFDVNGRCPPPPSSGGRDRGSRLALSFSAVGMDSFPPAEAIAHVMGGASRGHSAPETMIREDWHALRARIPAAAVAVAALDPGTAQDAWVASRDSAVGRWQAAKTCFAGTGIPVHCIALWLGGPDAPSRPAREAATKRLNE